MKFTITRIKIIAVTMATMAMLALSQIVSAQAAPQYLVTPIEIGDVELKRARDINNLGVVVLSDYLTADPHMLYDSQNGLFYDLNQLGNNATWQDLTTGNTWAQSDPGTPWAATEVWMINDNNQVVGKAISSLGDRDRVFVLEDPFGAPKFLLLPAFYDASGGEIEVDGKAINENGVIVGLAAPAGYAVVFDPADNYAPVGIPVPTAGGGGDAWMVTDFNTVGGDFLLTLGYDTQAYLISPDPNYGYAETKITSYNAQLYGINESRQVSGNRNHQTAGKPSDRQDGGVFRFQYGGPDSPGGPIDEDLFVVGVGSKISGARINEGGDVAFRFSDRPYIYLEGSGTYELNSIVNFSSLEDEAKWLANAPDYPRAINDLGQIILSGDNNTSFLLTKIDPEPGISISPTSGLVTDETGGTANFDVVLNTEPTADVTIAISSSNIAEGTVAKASLIFTLANWDIPQTVTITGVDDAIEDGDVAYTIVTAAATSTDPDYHGLDPVDVSVTNLDNDGGSQIYFSDDTPLNIRDRKNTFSTITIADDNDIIGLNVLLDITHSRPSDLTATLTGPDGTFVSLPTLDGFINVSNAFSGKSSRGQWTLEVRDNERNRETGTLNGWSITVDY